MVTKKQSRIKPLDSKIFASILKARRPLPVKKIANRVNVSWPTANRHVEKLKKLGVLKTKKSIRRTNVEVSDNFLKEWEKELEEFGF